MVSDRIRRPASPRRTCYTRRPLRITSRRVGDVSRPISRTSCAPLEQTLASPLQIEIAARSVTRIACLGRITARIRIASHVLVPLIEPPRETAFSISRPQ